MRRILTITSAIVGLLVIVAGAALWSVGSRGTSAIEGWVAGQIQLVAASYLNPKLSFADLDYEFPLTVRLKKLRLTADDPDHPGKTIDILGADRAEIELAEVPQVGKPVHITSVVLNDPLFQAVVARKSKQLIGFSNLVRPTESTTAALSSQPSPRLSEVIRMRRVELVNGRIVYDPRTPDSPPMELDQVSTRLDIEPDVDGLYRIHTRISREPLFELIVAGKVDLDRLATQDVAVDLKAQLGQDRKTYLPPALQQVVNKHDVQGALEMHLGGSFRFGDFKAANLQMHTRLTKANVSFDRWRVPVDVMEIDSSLENGQVTLASLRIEALGGEARMHGSLAFNDELDGKVSVTIRDMLLDQTLKPTTQPGGATYTGRVNAQLTASAPLNGTLPEKWGEGRIELDRARLIRTPVLRDLYRALGPNAATSQPADRASLVFTCNGSEARCSDISYQGDLFAVRGQGTVGLNRNLNLVLNAGPLEKMQSLMGSMGKALGKITDAVASYRVTGRIEQPQVNLELAGGAVNKMGNSVRVGVEKIGDQIAGSDAN